MEDRRAALAQRTCSECENESEREGEHRSGNNGKVQVSTHTMKGDTLKEYEEGNGERGRFCIRKSGRQRETTQ